MKNHLIDDARYWWRMWSVRAAGVFAVVLSAIVANPAPLLQFFATLPEPYKSLVPVFTLIVTFGVPTLLRLWKQPVK